MAPSNNISIYDNILYSNCYLKMFMHNTQDKSQAKLLENNNANGEQQNKDVQNNENKNNKANENNKNNTNNKLGESEGTQPIQNLLLLNDIKYKEIILDNSDISPQDYDFIKSNLPILD